MYEVPTLYVELVDAADWRRPARLMRSPVVVDLAPNVSALSVERRETYRVNSSVVRGGHRLGLGDVVVACHLETPERSCLVEVIEVASSETDRCYTLARLGSTTYAQWVQTSADPRWTD